MMAICPAGPPKLIKPSLSQQRDASPKPMLRVAVPVRSAGSDIGLFLGAVTDCPGRRLHSLFCGEGSAATGSAAIQKSRYLGLLPVAGCLLLPVRLALTEVGYCKSSYRKRR